MAGFHGYVDAIVALIARGGRDQANSKTERGDTSLHLACRCNRTAAIKVLLAEGDRDQVNAVNEWGESSLHEAGYRNTKNKAGNTALHLAVLQGSALAAAALLLHGVDATSSNNAGKTPRDLAETSGMIPPATQATQEGIPPPGGAAALAVEALLLRGADASASDKFGKTGLALLDKFLAQEAAQGRGPRGEGGENPQTSPRSLAWLPATAPYPDGTPPYAAGLHGRDRLGDELGERLESVARDPNDLRKNPIKTVDSSDLQELTSRFNCMMGEEAGNPTIQQTKGPRSATRTPRQTLVRERHDLLMPQLSIPSAPGTSSAPPTATLPSLRSTPHPAKKHRTRGEALVRYASLSPLRYLTSTSARIKWTMAAGVSPAPG